MSKTDGTADTQVQESGDAAWDMESAALPALAIAGESWTR